MALDEDTPTLITQAAMELAHDRFAAAVEDAGFKAVEITNNTAFQLLLWNIANRTVDDADANANVGAPSWSEQARERARLTAINRFANIPKIKHSLKDGLDSTTSESDWNATREWIDSEVARLTDVGVLRRIPPETGSGKLEIILSDMTEAELDDPDVPWRRLQED